MPDNDDSLRNALAGLAGQVGPAQFMARPLIRKAAARRARLAAGTGLCALAVAAAAVAVPMALRIQPGSQGPPVPPAAAAASPWPGVFFCGGSLPPGLPGAASDGIRITIVSVTRSASGPPSVRWSLHGSGAAIGPVSAGLLIVRGNRIFAAEPARDPSESGVAASPGLTVPQGRVYQYAPFLLDGTTGSWAAMWQRHQDYRVIIVATVWTGHGGSAIPVRLSVSAALPAG